MTGTNKKLRLALICGGPSAERGISLNSARSACDHLDAEDIEIMPIYYDSLKRAYKISRAQLYSNTPSDFDFKLAAFAQPLNDKSLKEELTSVDLVFPVIHGAFGEDGTLQKMLEDLDIPFIGSPSRACSICFDKFDANEFIREKGFFALPSMVLEEDDAKAASKLDDFFSEHKLPRAIVKPALGGSSIGVASVTSSKEAYDHFIELTKEDGRDRVVIEPFCNGIEFTIVILENRFNMPVAILPIEVETSYNEGQIFDYRKKYLATRQVSYHCPPRFDEITIERIQIQAEQLFSVFGMKDFARFDGWVRPDGNIWFNDFNPISGMEQNSFLFLSAAQFGMTHADVLRFLVKNACDKHNIPFNALPPVKSEGKKRVNIIFGGDTAERQVSLMSGTNTWLKLRASDRFTPQPYLLDPSGEVWELPYSLTLNHTVEDIKERCEQARAVEYRLDSFNRRIRDKLKALDGQISQENTLPKKLPLDKFIQQSELVFNTIHGGIGENGELQSMMAKEKVKFNGSDADTAKLCMDKYKTGEIVQNANIEGVRTAKKKLIPVKDFKSFSRKQYKELWQELVEQLSSESIIVKPPSDGCSAGVARLYNDTDLQIYVSAIKKNLPSIPEKALSEQDFIIEMPTSPPEKLLFEEFIDTDQVNVDGNQLLWDSTTDWIEITVGVLGKKGQMRALNPSITVSAGDVLSLEEKFQGGTGINITPPPEEFVSKKIRETVKKRIKEVANALGLSGYARIDAFMNRSTGDIVVIEANTLPALTGSTVIFHQALAEEPAMFPREFLEEIVSLSQ